MCNGTATNILAIINYSPGALDLLGAIIMEIICSPLVYEEGHLLSFLLLKEAEIAWHSMLLGETASSNRMQ